MSEPLDITDRAKMALAGTTEGPWRVVGYGNIWAPDGHPKVGKVTRGADASFAASARSLVPELVAEVDKLRAMVGTCVGCGEICDGRCGQW